MEDGAKKKVEIGEAGLSMKEIAELGKHLAAGMPSLNKVCQFLVLRSITSGQPIAAQILQLDSNGEIYVAGSFGRTPPFKPLNLVESRSLLSESVLENVVLGAGDWKTFMSSLLRTKGTEELDPSFTFKSSLIAPIVFRGALILYFDEKIRQSEEDDFFLLAVGSMLALHISRLSEASIYLDSHGGKKNSVVDESLESSHPGSSPRGGRALTHRQDVIVESLKRGKTNKEIAEDLDFSESLIRQETVQIYRKLGITGRKQLTTEMKR